MNREFKDYYKILRVARNATQQEIKKAYRELSFEYHPDRHATENLTEEELNKLNELQQEINEAYSVLKDEKSRTRYDFEYDEYLEELREEEERVQREREEAERRERARQRANSTRSKRTKESSQEQRKKRRHKNSTYETMKDNVYEAYKEIKEEEQENPFRERHHNLNINFHREYATKADTVPKVIVFYMAEGTVHVASEFLYQIDKLKYITQDSIPKYIIRNRKMAGVILSVVILSNILGGTSMKTATVKEVPVTTTTIEQSTDEEIASIETVEENTKITLTRNYTVRGGDTLSDLSYESGSSIQAINNMNGFSEDNQTIYYKDTMKIPYIVNSEDLQYYIQTVNVNNKSLSDIASDFDTDVETLIRLNPEAIETVQGNVYIIISDTLIVPNFISKDDLYEMKNSTNYDNATQYTKNN